MRRLSRAVAIACLATGCTTSVPSGTVERVTIPAGAAFGQVVDSLSAHGLVANRFWFKLLARIQGVDREVQAGVYEFRQGESAFSILNALAQGRAVAVRFTVPEGLTIAEVADLAESQLRIPSDSIVAATRDARAALVLEVLAPTIEGFLFPETYQVPVDITARALVQLMTGSFVQAWAPAWDARLDTLGLTKLQLVALASIVEGEARHDEERGTIAAVYHNRLRIGMALQADPTVQYAILLRTGKRKTRLYEKDYQIQSRYNTYLYPGLPPGPVSSPGRRSIVAALYPPDVPYLFFVAGVSGRHIFSRTYAEHLTAISRVRAEMRALRQEGKGGQGGQEQERNDRATE